MSEGHLEEAIAELRMGDEGACLYCANRLLGLTYDRAGEADSAILYYERSLATYEWSRRLADDLADGFFLPGAYQRLGDLYEEQGNTEKAIYYYGKFAEICKDAEPELQPRLEAAHRAISALSPDQ